MRDTAEELEAVMEYLRDCEMREEQLREQKAHLLKQRALLEAKLKELEYRAYGEQDDVPPGNSLHALKGAT